ncbi:MAG TPA: FAD-linked oxidase C-terminal domain-containing protein [Solirubrobacteraceae bacterium]|nr:FAD-linked oxidase C-terminal domain-containing protein [Solirubrobacteraceae bacterium]
MATTASKPDRPQVTTGPADVDISGLKRALSSAVSGEVRFDAGTRAMYANDFSIYRAVPIGVVIPRGPEDVIAGVAVCREHGAPVLPRGCGTAPSGQTTNVAVVFDYSKYYNQILELDPESRRARVQPGVICDQLRDAAELHHLTYGPDPATHEYCTFGGMLGNNSCGTHSLMAGKTSDNVIELDVVLYDGTRMRVGATPDDELERIIAGGGRQGEIYAQLKALRDEVADRVRAEFPDIPRRVSGYNLDQLLPENGFHVARALVGSEGTCANVLEATVRLVPSPQHRRTLVLSYPDVFQAADHVPALLETNPIGLEGYDDQLIKNMIAKHRLAAERAVLPEGRAWLYAEFGHDDPDEATAMAERALKAVNGGPQLEARVVIDKAEQVSAWKVRESAVGDSRAPGYMDAEGNWEDAAVHPDKLGAYLRDFQQILDDHGYRCVYYGHFGQGCVHTRMDFDLKSAAGVKTFRSFMEKCADLVVSYGGSLAGEYGEGHGRAELLPKMFGPELMAAFNRFKRIWDPDVKMNPNRLIGDVKLDEGLRLGPEYRPPQLKTHFAFPDDEGSFATAIERCFGMAKCRNLGSITMCPSFQVTREERHSTRGRSRLLFEMLKGDPVSDGWRDEAVKESLDLCLACKGCTGDCPVQVDIPTYKAEFLAHYYARRRRPLNHYVLGLLPWWGPVAARAPRLANALTHAPGIGSQGKRLVGIAPEREIPRFATQTFRDWHEKRRPAQQYPARPPVVLWADTFTNLFEPDIGKSALAVLDAAGFAPQLSPPGLCCGRPLYDFGMLATAKRALRRILDQMSAPIEAGWPVVVLEPSCASVFRDELRKLMPHDEHARRLVAQTLTLDEFLARHAPDWEPPRLDRKALVHPHCHRNALIGPGGQRDLLTHAGFDAELTNAGCCGMAGSFGYEEGERYEVSMAIGERVLLPAVRAADPDTVLVADGFSCRTQIEAGTGRRALHTAEALALGLQAIA